MNNAGKDGYSSDIWWFYDFLVQTTDAESVTALSSKITDMLPKAFSFSYVSIFLLGYDNKFCLGSETEDVLKKLNLDEIDAESIADFHEWPCELGALLYNIDSDKKPSYFEKERDYILEPVKSRKGTVGLLCYRLEDGAILSDQRLALDLAALQIAFSFERIIKGRRMIYGLPCEKRENSEVERIALRSYRQSCMAEMALGVADGIRNPITVIGGLVKRMSRQVDFENSLQKDWDILLKEAERLERLVKDFEDLGHKREVVFKVSDINQVVIQSVDTFKNEFLRGRKTQFDLNLEKAPCLARLDERLIEIALTHLYINALEATGEDGLISIYTTSLGEKIVIRVRDNGTGITPEFADRIFDPFFSTKSGGTGLGLTYVQQIINEHQGIIRVESFFGDGTTFIITLPGTGN